MQLSPAPPSPPHPQPPPPPHLIEIVEPDPDDCEHDSLLPEGNVKVRNYRVLTDNLRAYTPTGDVHTSPTKGKLVSKFDVCGDISVPRARILELVRAEDPGREALEAVVRPAPRRGLARPLDDDTRRFLQRALLSPSPQGLSAAPSPEPHYQRREDRRRDELLPLSRDELLPLSSDELLPLSLSREEMSISREEVPLRQHGDNQATERSLAEELREAEEGWCSGGACTERRRRQGALDAEERERLGRLALSVEEDEGESGAEGAGGGAGAGGALSAAGRRLDALLEESRELQAELAGISEDLQTSSARAGRCFVAARALCAESRALRYMDDLVALLRGDVAAAVRARNWPFAGGPRDPTRNYVV